MAVTALAAAGCNGPSEETVKEQSPPAKIYRSAEWRQDFNSVFDMQNVIPGNDGTTEYKACFRKSDGGCELAFHAIKDGFKKSYVLTPSQTKYEGAMFSMLENRGKAFLDMHIVALECDDAKIILVPLVQQKDWLFMNRVAFMADGDVVFEKVAEHGDVQRNVDSGITERWPLLLDENDILHLEKFANSSSRIIRISGENGYLTVSDNLVEIFSSDFQKTVIAAKRVKSAFAKGGGPRCNQ